MSNAWQGQSSMQDKLCSKQTQPLLQTDLPLHVHTSDLNKLRVKLATVKDSTLVRLPPSEDTFKQHVLRSSYQAQIWLT
jgi:hypothetical protein